MNAGSSVYVQVIPAAASRGCLQQMRPCFTPAFALSLHAAAAGEWTTVHGRSHSPECHNGEGCPADFPDQAATGTLSPRLPAHATTLTFVPLKLHCKLRALHRRHVEIQWACSMKSQPHPVLNSCVPRLPSPLLQCCRCPPAPLLLPRPRCRLSHGSAAAAQRLLR